MFNFQITLSNAKGEHVTFNKDVPELRKALNHTKYQYKSFFDVALRLMKKTNFCGVVLTQSVYCPEFPSINETREIAPSMLLQNDKILFEGMIDWAENQSERLENIGAKMILANFNHPTSTN